MESKLSLVGILKRGSLPEHVDQYSKPTCFHYFSCMGFYFKKDLSIFQSQTLKVWNVLQFMNNKATKLLVVFDHSWERPAGGDFLPVRFSLLVLIWMQTLWPCSALCFLWIFLIPDYLLSLSLIQHLFWELLTCVHLIPKLPV